MQIIKKTSRALPSLRPGFGRAIFILGLAFLLLLPKTALAGEKEPPEAEAAKNLTYGGQIDFVSRYVWRGIGYTDGPVMQPSAWVSFYNVYFGVWADFVLNDEPNQGKFDEVDLILSYRYEWKKISVEPTVQFYFYPSQEEFFPNTGEASVKISYDLEPFRFFTTHNFDIVEYPGSYFGDMGAAFSHSFHPQFSLETSIALGWGNSKFNDAYIGIPHGALNLFAATLSLEYTPVKFLSLKPHMEVSRILDTELGDELGEATIVSGGLAVGFEF